ncbi:hypothetical protein [Silicimonas algicola]|nr:hypothetical protein [Silicimonas algicola]
MPRPTLVAGVSAASLLFLALLGAWAAGANVVKAIWRVTFWGTLAVALTGIGAVFGSVQ